MQVKKASHATKIEENQEKGVET